MRDVTKAAAVLCMLHGEAARDSMRKEEVVMNSFRLTEEEVNYLAEKYPTPFMVVSLDKVEKNYHYLRHRLPRVKVFYAIKANPEPAVLTRLAGEKMRMYFFCPASLVFLCIFTCNLC